MKENKYKVWCKDKNEWEKDLSFLSENGTLFYRNPSCGKFHIELRPCKPENHIAVFYTGLLDKNSKEIYEGDIVKHTNQICEVFYSTEWCSFKLKNKFYRSPMGDDQDFVYEVIGNIYENPELLAREAHK